MFPDAKLEIPLIVLDKARRQTVDSPERPSIEIESKSSQRTLIRKDLKGMIC
jgi:hypothetical protein